jgi:hypothetical protein
VCLRGGESVSRFPCAVGVGLVCMRQGEKGSKSETGWVAGGYRVSSCRRKWHETLPSVENDRRYWIEKNGLPICDCGYWGKWRSRRCGIEVPAATELLTGLGG